MPTKDHKCRLKFLGVEYGLMTKRKMLKFKCRDRNCHYRRGVRLYEATSVYEVLTQ